MTKKYIANIEVTEKGTVVITITQDIFYVILAFSNINLTYNNVYITICEGGDVIYECEHLSLKLALKTMERFFIDKGVLTK